MKVQENEQCCGSTNECFYHCFEFFQTFTSVSMKQLVKSLRFLSHVSINLHCSSVLSRTPSSDWLWYSHSILLKMASSVAAYLGAASFSFRSVCEEDLDENFDRLVDLY